MHKWAGPNCRSASHLVRNRGNLPHSAFLYFIPFSIFLSILSFPWFYFVYIFWVPFFFVDFLLVTSVLLSIFYDILCFFHRFSYFFYYMCAFISYLLYIFRIHHKHFSYMFNISKCMTNNFGEYTLNREP